MEFKESYRGVRATIRLDYRTKTYIGEIDLPETTTIQAGSYQQLQGTLRDAIEKHLANASRESTEDEWRKVVNRQYLTATKKPEEATDDDPFKRRRFLR